MARVLLFSGGLDSVIAWHLLDRPRAVYVRLGHEYEAAELTTLARLVADVPDLGVDVVEGPPVGTLEHLDGHIPHRNLILAATVAAHYPTATRIMVGALLGESSPDKSPRFFRAVSRALTVSEARPVRVVAPFRSYTKTALVRRYLDDGGDPDLLARTRSCYAPGPDTCGACQACFRRWVALSRNGLPAGPMPTVPDSSMRNVVTNWRRAGVRQTPALAINNVGAAWAVLRDRLKGGEDR